jgi:hypothetical protein
LSTGGRPTRASAPPSEAAARSNDPARLTLGELIGAISSALLLVLMFAFAWFGVDGIPGRPRSQGGAAGSETGWQALSDLRWLILLTVIVAFAAVAVHALRPARQAVAAIRLALLALGTLTSALLIVRVLIDLPSPDRVVDQKLGGVLGVAAALGIAYGGFEAVREQRARLLGLSRLPVARTAR